MKAITTAASWRRSVLLVLLSVLGSLAKRAQGGAFFDLSKPENANLRSSSTTTSTFIKPAFVSSKAALKHPPEPAQPLSQQDAVDDGKTVKEQRHDDDKDGDDECATNGSASKQQHERGKVLDRLDAAELYQAYLAVQQDYQERAFGSNSNGKDDKWKVLFHKDDVEVALLPHPDDPTCPYVRLTGTFPVPVQDCWDFMLIQDWDENMPKMDPFYEGVTTHGEFIYHPDTNKNNNKKTNNDDCSETPPAVQMIVCRKRSKRVVPFGKRDTVFVSVQDVPLPDGTLVSGSVSIVCSADPQLQRQPGYKRAYQDSISFYKPVVGADGSPMTRVTIVCRMDLNDHGPDGRQGGCHVPMWLYVKTLGRTGAQSVFRMRKALLEEQQKKKKEATTTRHAAAATASAVTTTSTAAAASNGETPPPQTTAAAAAVVTTRA